MSHFNGFTEERWDKSFSSTFQSTFCFLPPAAIIYALWFAAPSIYSVQGILQSFPHVRQVNMNKQNWVNHSTEKLWHAESHEMSHWNNWHKGAHCHNHVIYSRLLSITSQTNSAIGDIRATSLKPMRLHGCKWGQTLASSHTTAFVDLFL